MPDHVLIPGSDHGPATGLRPAGTGVCGSVIQLVAVIVGELFAWGDVPQRDNPDGPGGQVGGAVGVTGMIDVAGGVAARLPVDIIAVIEVKEIDIACC